MILSWKSKKDIRKFTNLFPQGARPCPPCPHLQAGGIVRVGMGGPWYAALPEEAWPQEAEQRAQILKDFQEPHGDRRWVLALL